MKPITSHDYCSSKNWINAEQAEQLKAVIKVCFDGVSSEQYFQKYFVASNSFKRDLRLYYANEKIVGYCLLTFEVSENKVLIRASAGFYPEFRQGGNTLSFSIKTAFRYWLCHPWQQIYYADTMLSPAMYRAITKSVAITYPSDLYTDGKALFEALNTNGLVSEYTGSRCLVAAGRRTNYSEEEISAFKRSDKPEIRFYCNANPTFSDGMALFVIMPVGIKQLVFTLFKWLRA